MSAHQRIRNTQRPQLESCKSSMSDVHMVEGGRYLWGGWRTEEQRGVYLEAAMDASTGISGPFR